MSSTHVEQSFIKSQMKGKPGRKSKNDIVLAAIQGNTAVFFSKKVLSDEMELAFWQTFMTGVGPDGKPVKLDAICWSAFKQAVAYKRGMPTVRVDNQQKEDVQITFNVIGGSAPSSFRKVISEEQKAKTSESMIRTLAAKRESQNILDMEVVDSEQVNSEV